MSAQNLSGRKRKIAKTLLMLAPLGLCLTGCAGTLHNRWATQDDTLEYWHDSIQTAPVEVHGGFAGHDASMLARSIPNGTTPELYPTQGHPQASLASTPRIVLYVGMNQIPADDTYCSQAPVLRAVAVDQGKVDVAAALCDGTRLVVRARRDLTPEHFAGHGVASVVHAIKSRLMLALSTNPNAPAETNG